MTHEDPKGCEHGRYSEGLRKSLFNFMHGVGLNNKLDFWFDFTVPKTTHPKRLIANILEEIKGSSKCLANDRVLWLGGEVSFAVHEEDSDWADLYISTQLEEKVLSLPSSLAEWFTNLLVQLQPDEEPVSFEEVDEFHKQYFNDSIKIIVDDPFWHDIREAGLIFLR